MAIRSIIGCKNWFLDSSSAAQESIEPEQTAKDTFTIASTDTHNSIEEKKKASNDEQADFDDVFSSVPAWMDVPEEYLDIRWPLLHQKGLFIFFE